jgi:hypothetical protein
MDNNLTDRSFWKAFWESRIGLIFNIKRDYIFGDILGKLKAQKTTNSYRVRRVSRILYHLPKKI